MKKTNAVRSTTARALGIAGSAITVALFASACGSDDSSSTTTATTAAAGTTSSAPATDPVLAKAEAVVKKLSTPTGSYTSPPTDGPKATPGKKVVVVGYGNLSPASTELQEEWVKNIGPALKWQVKYVDGKFDPGVWLNAIRDAVNTKADGIVVQFIDCGSVKAGLLAAKKANIPVITIGGEDCAGTPLFTGVIGSNYGTIKEADAAYGAAQAAWTLVDSEGKANVMSFENSETAGTKLWTNAWKSGIAECTACKLQSASWSFGDLGPKLQQKAQQSMLKAPDADYVYGQVDDAITGGIAAGVQASGRKVKIIGFDCQPGVMKLMKQGKVAVCFDDSARWTAYSAADGLVRSFGGQKPSSETGRGLRIVTPDVNFPADPTKSPEPAIDFRKIYETAWGVQ